MQFKQWLENLNGPNSLPPIPTGFTRLTHFTSDRVANNLLQGQNFDYSKQGLIFSTSDPHSNNQQVWDTITSGMAGAFTRNTFGTAIVLIDLSNYEVRLHQSITSSPKYVENRKVVGVVYQPNMDFKPNPNYNPQGDQKIQTPKIKQKQKQTQTIPIPHANQSVNIPDVW